MFVRSNRCASAAVAGEEQWSRRAATKAVQKSLIINSFIKSSESGF